MKRTGKASRSAVDRNTARQKPAGTAAKVSQDVRTPTLFNSEPVLDPRVMALTLGAIGFDARSPTKINPEPPRALAAETLTVPLEKQPQQPQSRLAETQEWLRRVEQRQRALSPVPSSIPSIGCVSAEAFLDLFYATGRPVLFPGIANHWPAVSRWTPEYLIQEVGSAEITYQGGRASASDFELVKDRHTRKMPFDEFVTKALERTLSNDAYITAYNSASNRLAFSPLSSDLGQLPWLTDEEGMLWIGPAGTFTPLHHDLTNNMLVQISGRKQLVLLPPCETGKLANSRHVFSDVHDIENHAKFSEYPAAKLAQQFVVNLNAGDALFIPVGWWHQVKSRSFSVTLTYTNFLWPNDSYQDFPTDRY